MKAVDAMTLRISFGNRHGVGKCISTRIEIDHDISLYDGENRLPGLRIPNVGLDVPEVGETQQRRLVVADGSSAQISMVNIH